MVRGNSPEIVLRAFAVRIIDERLATDISASEKIATATFLCSEIALLVISFWFALDDDESFIVVVRRVRAEMLYIFQHL